MKKALALFGLVACFAACQKTPTDLREWSPKDHTNTSNSAAGAAPGNNQVSAQPAASAAPPKGLDPVTLATWTSNCSICHGKVGQGDGPQGQMLKATDLSKPEWQSSVTDEQIRAAIVGGKNQMPAFPNLAAATVNDLVMLVRWFNSDQEALKRRLRLERGQTSAPVEPAAASGPAAANPTPKTATTAGAAVPAGTDTKATAKDPSKKVLHSP